MKPQISIIIVNYNSGELLFNCLTSIKRELQQCKYEVVVVDNCSTDNSIGLCAGFETQEPAGQMPEGGAKIPEGGAKIPEGGAKMRQLFKIIRSGENLGFAKGCNLGAEHSCGEILHFLNPDTQLQPGADLDYAKVIHSPDKIYVTPLINRDGTTENGKMAIPMLRDIFWWNLNRSRARFWCKGASVIVSRENFEKVGRWCEEYFMYGEDTDLFYSFWKHNMEIEMLQVPVFHYGGGCSENVWSNIRREVIVQRSFRRFFRRHSNMVHYVCVKLYYLMHNLIKHPSKVPFDIKAWWKS